MSENSRLMCALELNSQRKKKQINQNHTVNYFTQGVNTQKLISNCSQNMQRL